MGGMLEIDADLSALHRIQSSDSNQKRCGLSGRCITGDTSIGPLSLWERAGVRATEVHRPCQILSQMPLPADTNQCHGLGYDSPGSLRLIRHSVCILKVHRSATPPRRARIAV